MLTLIIFIYLVIYIANNVDITDIHTACLSNLLTIMLKFRAAAIFLLYLSLSTRFCLPIAFMPTGKENIKKTRHIVLHNEYIDTSRFLFPKTSNGALIQTALVSFPRHKFARSPCCCQ